METFIATYAYESNAQSAMEDLIDAGFDPGMMEFMTDVEQKDGLAYESVEEFENQSDAKAFVENIREGHSIVALQCSPKREKEALEIFKKYDPADLESRRTRDRDIEWSADRPQENDS